jgi:PAS domain-containing protein
MGMNVSAEPTIPSDASPAPAERALESVWPMTFIAALVALWTPWYLRALDVDIGRIAWLLTLATGAHIIAWPLLADIRDTRVGSAALLTLHGLSLLVLGVVWILLGAMKMPLFLIFFAPPILAAPAARGVWERTTAFGLALPILLLAALLASPSLRWYGAQLGLPLTLLDPISARLGSFGAPSEENVAPTAAAVSLGLVGAALAALYACASTFAAANRGAIEWLHQTIATLRKDKGLALELLQSSPLPEALVLPESARIVLVNDRFRSMFASAASATEGARLQELVKLQFPETLERLVQSGDGTVDGRCPGPDGRLREVRMHVRRSKHEEAHVARVSFEDRTAERQLEGVLDTIEVILLVLDGDGALLYANTAARAVFYKAARGAAAASALHRPELPDRWWRAPEETTVPRQISISGKGYRGTVSCRKLDGLGEPFTVIALSPASAP